MPEIITASVRVHGTGESMSPDCPGKHIMFSWYNDAQMGFSKGDSIMNNGSRIETYVIEGKADSGVICLNGAAARCGQVGDQVIIMSYVWLDEKEGGEHKPKIVIVESDNRIAEG